MYNIKITSPSGIDFRVENISSKAKATKVAKEESKEMFKSGKEEFITWMVCDEFDSVVAGGCVNRLGNHNVPMSVLKMLNRM